jgi:hypothetical protein
VWDVGWPQSAVVEQNNGILVVKICEERRNWHQVGPSPGDMLI